MNLLYDPALINYKEALSSCLQTCLEISCSWAVGCSMHGASLGLPPSLLIN